MRMERLNEQDAASEQVGTCWASMNVGVIVG